MSIRDRVHPVGYLLVSEKDWELVETAANDAKIGGFTSEESLRKLAARMNVELEKNKLPKSFFPSQLNTNALFASTFDRTETELTALLIVITLTSNGNMWRIVSCDELAKQFVILFNSDNPLRFVFNNPFYRVDLHGLVDGGYATWIGSNAIEFTVKGLQQLARWVV